MANLRQRNAQARGGPAGSDDEMGGSYEVVPGAEGGERGGGDTNDGKVAKAEPVHPPDYTSDIDGDDEKSPFIFSKRDGGQSDGDSDDDEKTVLRRRRPATAPSDLEPLDERFNPPPPAAWKRVFLVLFTVVLFWVALKMRAGVYEAKKRPAVVHAKRYSKDYKFRPAASPVITETLKDGRLRLRGAPMETSATPSPSPPPAPLKRKKAGKAKRKTRGSGGKAKKRG